MSEPEGTSRYSTFVAVVIALVSVFGAVVAWRVAVASGDAGSADTRGVLATVEEASIGAQASAKVSGHQMAFAGFMRNQALADALLDVAGFENLVDALEGAAARARDFIPQAYIDRNEQFDAARAFAESKENLAFNKDTQPQPHFDAADAARAKATWLLFDLIWLGVALLCLTLADALQNSLRYLFLIGGVGVFAVGVLFALAVELVSALS